jgi:hypothetical protein
MGARWKEKQGSAPGTRMDLRAVSSPAVVAPAAARAPQCCRGTDAPLVICQRRWGQEERRLLPRRVGYPRLPPQWRSVAAR